MPKLILIVFYFAFIVLGLKAQNSYLPVDTVCWNGTITIDFPDSTVQYRFRDSVLNYIEINYRSTFRKFKYSRRIELIDGKINKVQLSETRVKRRFFKRHYENNHCINYAQMQLYNRARRVKYVLKTKEKEDWVVEKSKWEKTEKPRCRNPFG